jgi:hypothetical protein
MADPWSTHILRLGMGALAGLTATLVKYWSHDHARVFEMILKQQNEEIVRFSMGYSIGLIVLVFLGCISAWIVHEYDFRKMFWVGLSAPSLFAAGIPPLPAYASVPVQTTWIENIGISTANAADDMSSRCVGDTAFVKGFKTFFGVPSERGDRYVVIIGSYRQPERAQARARQINEQEPSLRARVGARACSSDYYPVIVGEPATPDEASKTLSRVLKLDIVEDAYLSPGPR